MDETLISLIVFLFVTGVATAFAFVLPRYVQADRQVVSRRMLDEFHKENHPTSHSILFRALPLSTPDLENPEQPAEKPPWRIVNWFQLLLAQTDVRLTGRQFLAISGGMFVGLLLLGCLLRGLILGIPAGIVGGATPLVLLLARARQRRERMMKQLPAAFDLMARVLRSGQSLPQAFQAVADSFDGPLSAEFAHCQMQQNLGLRVDVVLREMADRTGILEMRIFVMAMLLHRQSGGNLSDLLDRLGNLVRARIRLRKQVQTLTAEGRLQGWTLAALPIVMFFALMMISPSYAQVLLEHSSLLLATATAMILGLLWIRQIVNFEP